MNRNISLLLFTACSFIVTSILGVTFTPTSVSAKSATSNRVTYKMPEHFEKYLFLNTDMVTIANPQVTQGEAYSQEDYLIDVDTGGSYTTKTRFDDNTKFLTSKKGFLFNIFNWIGTLGPIYPPDVNLHELERRIEKADIYSEERRELTKQLGEIKLSARLQALIEAGYVKPEEIDDGRATKEFVATILYRILGETRPYHGGIDLKDSEDIAVRWAVEVGLPGFPVDSKGFLYPQTRLRMEAGPDDWLEEYAYQRLFDFLTLILPGRKTATGWEYYQLSLKPGMVPVRYTDLIEINGQPFEQNRVYAVMDTVDYKNFVRKVNQYATPRFQQILDLARQDALKPRAWDWSRDLIHHPKFAKEVAAYRKNKSAKNLQAVYQAVGKHYNLNRRQDSAAVIKSVLDNVK
ncbi:hypothetical protein NDK47_05875 [Brevibacillus ruminantium]|uniref:S-layer homology domain-containing protein n=1 Tax=Brevibacillus ruminantium TaxID=2950604 RepID=A0ABY4WJ57_9BACL|nr:hypothetical protein [Brevibacillus ruminantium]USG66826.1 hypothetical protein NDK47_05875 [Brevibacillus ruminantium]